MTCPVCGGKTTVVDTHSDCESIYRRRKCVECKYTFFTEETESKTARNDLLRLHRELDIISKNKRGKK